MQERLSSVGVYCGSSPGDDICFARAAASLGEVLARRNIRLVYGGGAVGLMGVLADAVIRNGGEVHGVITKALVQQEVAHDGLTKLHVVDTMHERKAVIAARSDGFIMMPGGLGTLDEFFEVATWTQLGVHSKPCGVLNVRGYFDPFLALLEGAVERRFLRAEHRDMIITEPEHERLLDRLATWQPVTISKWLDRAQHQAAAGQC